MMPRRNHRSRRWGQGLNVDRLRRELVPEELTRAQRRQQIQEERWAERVRGRDDAAPGFAAKPDLGPVEAAEEHQ